MRDQWSEYQRHKATALGLDDPELRELEAAKAVACRYEACRMAIAAAPYLHPRLAAMALTGADGGAIQVNIEGDDAILL
jgi:hypothetical protein